MAFNQAPQGEPDLGANAPADPGSVIQRPLRVRLVLIAAGAALITGVLAGCGQKGPLTLPKPVDAAGDPARKPARP